MQGVFGELCVSGSWNRLPHADSNQSTVTNIYSQSCDTVSSLPSLHPEDTFSSSFQSQLASQEVVRLSPSIPHSLSQHNSKLYSIYCTLLSQAIRIHMEYKSYIKMYNEIQGPLGFFLSLLGILGNYEPTYIVTIKC